MLFKIGNFEIETHRASLFLRIPLLGQAFIGQGLTSFDSWRSLKQAREV